MMAKLRLNLACWHDKHAIPAGAPTRAELQALVQRYLNGSEVVVDGGVMLQTRTRRVLIDARRFPAAVVRRS